MAGRMCSAVLTVILVMSGCTSEREHTASAPVSSSAPTTATPGPAQQSLAAAIRQWEDRTGDLFTRSAQALKQISEASDDGDEAAVRSGCRQLHDANAVRLQRLLPTPDPELTAELQRMIDDMNIATHACLRFVISRESHDSANYQDYLARAVEHLQRAKVILDADLRQG